MQSLPTILLLASAVVAAPLTEAARHESSTPAGSASRGRAEVVPPAAGGGSAEARPEGTKEDSGEQGDEDGLVRLTAVVTDRRGQPLAGLKPGDFNLVVDGAAQKLESAELTRGSAAPRAFAFFLDEFHVAEADSIGVRESLLRFVDTQLRPADVVMVVKPLDSLDTIATTADRQAVRDAIATFQGRKGDYTPRSAFERDYMAQAPAAVASARAQIVTSALRAISTSLSQKDGIDTAIVLISDGFSRMRTGRNLPADLQAAVRIATRAEAPVYAFAPSPAPPQAGDEPQPAAEALAALAAVTSQTGGQLVTGTAGFDAGLAVLARDLDTHYVLTYRPAHGSDGRFREVRIGIEREGAQIRTRAGYVAPAAPVGRAAAPLAMAPLRVLRRSALIQSWAGFFPTTPDRGTVTLTWEPAAARAGTAPRSRASTIAVTASTHDGTVLFDALVAAAGAPASPGVANAATFDAPLGPVRVDMKILDASGVVIDTDARDVTAPNARKGLPTIFSPAVVRTRSAREFRDALANVHAAPVATREFRRTERLLIRVPALDASGDPVPVAAVLLNRLRQPMRDLPALDEQAPHGATQFDLSLAPLAPGDYTIRLTATSPAGAVSEYVSFRVQG